MRPFFLSAMLVIGLAGLDWVPRSAAHDWTQWRGPARDGHVPGLILPEPLPGQLHLVWKTEVGQGHSSPVVEGKRVFVLSRVGENEVVRAIGLADGKQIWSQTYAAPFKMSPYTVTHGKGPKSTPIVAGGRLYTFGIGGILSAWDASRGKQLWQRDFGKQFTKASPMFYGNCMSPLIVGNRLIVHVGCHDEGALSALDCETGKTLWQWTEDGPGYASPVIATLDGTKQVITQSQNACIGVAFADGSLLWKLVWKIEYKTEYDQNIVTPIVDGRIVVFADLGKPTTAWRLSNTGGKWSPEQVWENTDLSMYMSSPVVVGNRLVGLSNKKKGQFVCLDLGSGKTLWTSDGRMGDYAALLAAGDTLLALTNNGELLVFRPGASRFEVLARYKVSEKQTWPHPAVAGSSLLIKDETALALWTW